jgi:multimeric flavodoxin WrbA
MRALVALEGSPQAAVLLETIRGEAAARGITVDAVLLLEGEVRPCTGCLACLRNEDRACIAKDGSEALRLRIQDCDAVLFLSPALFGQCSSAIKNAMDKGVAVKPYHGREFPA